MQIEYKNIRTELLELNIGQVDGIPKNPRLWKRENVDDLAKSIKETPELLSARGLIVVPYRGKYVVIGGNMRLEAIIKLGHKDAPCIVMEDADVDTILKIVIKDNASIGKWDEDELIANWGDVDMNGWGIQNGWLDMKIQEAEKKTKEESEKSVTMEFSLEPDDYYAAVGVLRGFDSDNKTALMMALELL